MTFENYIVIAIGIVLVVCDPIIVRHREKIARFYSDFYRALGGPVGRTVAKGSSPKWIEFFGVVLIIFGLVAVLMGIFMRE